MFNHKYVIPVSQVAMGTTIGLLMFLFFALLSI
jgi:hypothetical protein